MTPFWANYNYHPMMQFKPPKDPSFRSQVQADSWMAGVEEMHRILRENIIQAQEQQTQYAGGNEMINAVGDKVWLSTRNLITSRLSRKLDYKRTGPYPVSKIINKNECSQTRLTGYNAEPQHFPCVASRLLHTACRRSAIPRTAANDSRGNRRV